MHEIHLPRTIDEPPVLLVWRVDHVAPIFLGIFVGLLIDQVWVMILVGFVAAWAYSRFEHGVPDGHVLHWLYWVGLWPTRGRTMRNPYRRLLLP